MIQKMTIGLHTRIIQTELKNVKKNSIIHTKTLIQEISNKMHDKFNIFFQSWDKPEVVNVKDIFYMAYGAGKTRAP